MTTFTLSGQMLGWNDRRGTITSVKAGKLELTTSENFRMRYDYVFEEGETYAQIDAGRGAAYQFRIGGVLPSDGVGASIYTMTWNGKSTVVLEMQYTPPGSNYDQIGLFELGGARLPVFRSVTDVNRFLASVSSVEDTARSHAVGPGKVLDVMRFLSYSSKTENDRIVLPAGIEDVIEADIILTGRGDDHLTGNEFANKANMGPGQDVALGGGGNDTLAGGAGDDRLAGGSGHDLLSGDDGNDTLRGDHGNDTLRGGNGDDRLAGGFGHDMLEGGFGADYLAGDAGNDTLNGNPGNDRLFGGAGNDRLDGGTGNDILTGGAGADTFVYRASNGATRVTDYEPDRDQIMIYGHSNAASLARQSGDDVVFRFAPGQWLLIEDARRADVLDDLVLI